MADKRHYRADIDGLRALAVLPIILFHAGLLSIKGATFPGGGYVGVDIFFVISGFLISRIIYEQIGEGTYSILEFYSRRVRRIFPAMVAVYLFCLAFVAVFGVLGDAREVRNSVVASLLFVSNIHFSGQAGYFDSVLQNNPLLHTWSLSIEEQFYVLFPILLFALRGLSERARIAVLAGLVIASLITCILMTEMDPVWAYYSIFARAWELGIGGLLAISKPRIASSSLARLMGIAGFSAIVMALVAFNKTTPFPGVAAVLPTVGTALVILAGQHRDGLVTQMLSLQPVRWIGLISYSLYLWHWPLIVFARQLGFSSRTDMWAVLLAAFVVSVLSWRFIEQPFRRGGNRKPAGRWVGQGAVAMGFTAAIALAVVPLNAAIRPPNAQIDRLAAFNPHPSIRAMRGGSCFLSGKYHLADFNVGDCLTPSADRKNVLLLGDSHAAQLNAMLRAHNPGVNIMQATASGCLPLLGSQGRATCVDLWRDVTRRFLPKHHLDAIILAGYWSASSPERAIATARALSAYADEVLIIGPNPTYTIPFPRALAVAESDHDLATLDRYRTVLPREVDDRFETLAPFPARVHYISYFRTICRTRCPLYSSSGEPTDFDRNHLSLSATGDFIRAAGTRLDFASATEVDRQRAG